MNPLVTTTLATSATAALFTGGLVYASIAPANHLWGNVISRGTTLYPSRCALTFDDGPTAESTPQILDTLQHLNVRATFFVIGLNVQHSPKLLARIHRDGLI